jgi:hypothetical protein
MADSVSYLEEGLKQGLWDLQEEDVFSTLEQRRPDELVEAGRRAVHLAVARFLWDERLGPMLDTGQVCQQLGVTRQAVAKAVGASRLVALPAGNTRRFPVWQFSFAERTEIRPQVAQIIAAFREIYPDVRPLHIASWAMTVQPELDNATPAAWLDRAGAMEPLLQAAERAAWALAQ